MKNVTRRTSLATIAAGIFGGPAVARHAMKPGYTIPPSAGYTTKSPSNYYGNEVQAADAANPLEKAKYLREEKERLENTIAGKYNEHQQEELNRYNKINSYTNIDALKSVSTSYKNIMNCNKSVKEMKSNWVEDAQKRLAQLLKSSIFG